MTKPRKVLVWAIALALAALPGAAAHGAGEAREVDLRVLSDDDGALGYGGCGPSEEAGAPCPTPPEGLDVLALDVREAWLGDAPAIAFRMIFQSGAAVPGRGLTLTLTANGTQGYFMVASPDGVAYTSDDFDLLQGPFDVFDGHPKALDGWLRLSTLGVAAGGELTGIRLDSTRDGDLDDVMPGVYYSNGVEMPHLPHGADPAEALEEHLPGTYAVKGPALLIGFDATPSVLDLARSANLTVKVGNPLAATTQMVTVTVLAPAAGRFPGGGPNVTVSLDAGATRELTVAWPGGATAENATLVATSDLGGRAERSVLVVPAPAVAGNATQDEPRKDAPGTLAAPLAFVLLVLAAVARRRR